MARVPETFSLMNRDYTVKYSTAEFLESEIGEKVYGAVDMEEAKIYLVPHPNRDHLEHTYFHELAHALTKAIGRDDLCHDEAFVDALGGALHQYEKTKVGSTTLKKGKETSDIPTKKARVRIKAR